MNDRIVTASTQQRIVFFKQRELGLAVNLFPKTGFETTGEYDRTDIINHFRKQVVEIKIREFDYTFFMTKYNGNYFIEVDKYNSIKQKADELGYKPVYVFGFTNKEGNVISYSALDLSKLDESEFDKKSVLCPKEMVKDSGKRYKESYFIPAYLINEYNNIIRYFTTPIITEIN